MSLQTINFDRLQLKPDDRLLDLGCGEGRHVISAYLAEKIDAVGVDLSIKDLKTALARFSDFVAPCNRQEDELNKDSSSIRSSTSAQTSTQKSLILSVANGGCLPFQDESFDKLICSEVLEHLSDSKQVLSEIHRVVKQGGILAISVPRFFPEWVCWQLSAAYHEVEGGHVRIFTARQLRKKIEGKGFIFFGKHHAHALHVPYWWLKCLFWRDSEEPEAKLVAGYHRFLVWDLMQEPGLTRMLDKCLNPIMGKSLVMYFVKSAPGTSI